MDNKERRDKFKALLDEHHIWPTKYMFKFIVESEKVNQVIDILDSEEVSVKHSRKGKYASVSMYTQMASSDEVMSVYEKIYQVEGVISL